MLLVDADIGTKVLHIAPGMNPDELMIISDDPHECGWPERITYVGYDAGRLFILRSGCANCEAEREVPALVRESSGSQTEGADQ